MIKLRTTLHTSVSGKYRRLLQLHLTIVHHTTQDRVTHCQLHHRYP